MKNKKQCRFLMNRGKTLVLSMVISANVSCICMAASPDFARTDQEWETIRDNRIEYEELGDLIHEYNATVQDNLYEYNKFRQDYGDTNDEVVQAYYDLAEDYYSEMTGDDDASSRMSDLNLQIQGDNLQTQGDESLEDSKIYQLTYEQAEKNLVAEAQSKMISYYEALLQKKQAEMDLKEAQTALELYSLKKDAGTATELDVLQARETAETKEDERSELDIEIQSIRESLQILLGWKYNDNPEIGELPEIDTEKIAAADLQSDTEKALENNYSLKINERKLENARGENTKKQLNDTIENNKNQIAASLSSAYQQIQSALLAWEQAKTEAELEESRTQNAQVELEAGVITQYGYDTQVYARDRSQISVETAAIALFTAMENYTWAVNGLAAAQ